LENLAADARLAGYVSCGAADKEKKILSSARILNYGKKSFSL